MTEEERAARAARAAQRAAEAPSREGAERAQQRASRRPTAAQASANQAAGGNYADRRNLLINQGQDEYNRAVTRDATKIPRAPGGQRTGYGSPGVPPPPSPFGAAANAAGTVARGAARLNPALNAATSSTAAANATLTGTEAGRRLLAEDAARRAGSSRADADMENPMPRPRMGVEPRADADMENPAPSVSMVAAEAAARNARRAATRPATRMSPREMKGDELNNISLGTLDPESGIAEMRGVRGEAARNIIARRADQERQRELEAMKKGGPVKKMAKGGVVKSSASGRSDGCAVKGKTKGRMV